MLISMKETKCHLGVVFLGGIRKYWGVDNEVRIKGIDTHLFSCPIENNFAPLRMILLLTWLSNLALLVCVRFYFDIYPRETMVFITSTTKIEMPNETTPDHLHKKALEMDNYFYKAVQEEKE